MSVLGAMLLELDTPQQEKDKMKSVSENTVEEMTDWIIANASRVISRELEGLEKDLIQYAVIQMKYEFWR